MGNSHSDEGVIEVRHANQLRDGCGHIVSEDDDDEVMVALSSTPMISPLLIHPASLEELDSLFDAAELVGVGNSNHEYLCPPNFPAFDAFTVMRIQVAWQTHVRTAAQRASAQQTKMQEKLYQCDKKATKTLQTMQTHTLNITEFVASLADANSLVKDVRDTRIRLQLLTEAAKRVEKVIELVEKQKRRH